MEDFDFSGVVRLIAERRAERIPKWHQLPEDGKQITLYMERSMREQEDLAIKELGFDPIPDDELTPLIKELPAC